MKIDGAPVVPVVPRPTPVVKRVIDVCVAIVGLVALAPILVSIALLVRLDSPGPVLFHQRRVGRGGIPFVMYKFRTMQVDAGELLPALQDRNRGGDRLIRIPDDPRVTGTGRWLRRSGLDELPQLVNVLRGEMSLIGPRPQIPSEVVLYTGHEQRRLEVLPGISGLWQVTSRDDSSFDEWVRLDLQYIDNWSLHLDMRITLKTLWTMLRLSRTGSSDETSVPEIKRAVPSPSQGSRRIPPQ